MNKAIKFLLFLSFLACDADEDELQILVETDKTEYLVNEDIQVSISNLSEKSAYYFRCDNVDLSPSHILRFEKIRWQEEEQFYLCTFRGPSGFIGSLAQGSTEIDLTSLEKRGMYRLRYEFKIDGVRRYYESNMFKIR